MKELCLALLVALGCNAQTADSTPRDAPGSGNGSESGSACTCSNGGVCFEQVGGPAMQGSGSAVIQCYPPSACTGGCATPCDEIVGQGTCSPDPDVSNLCICDNGIR